MKPRGSVGLPEHYPVQPGTAVENALPEEPVVAASGIHYLPPAGLRHGGDGNRAGGRLRSRDRSPWMNRDYHIAVMTAIVLAVDVMTVRPRLSTIEGMTALDSGSDASPPPPSLERVVPSLVQQLARAWRLRLEQELRPFDITAQQAVLLIRSAWQIASPYQLTGALGIDSAGMSRLMDRLEQKRLIVRRGHPEDRRSVLMELTPAGRALAPRLRPLFERLSRQLLTGFSEEEMSQFKTFLQRGLENLAALQDGQGTAEPPTTQ
jgi:DNA-binding MarR family transcriptional regulator